MLVLSRRVDDKIMFKLDEATLLKLLETVRRNDEPEIITVSIVRVIGNVARIGIEADRDIPVVRGELFNTEPSNRSKENP